MSKENSFINIIIADDHIIFREGLKRILASHPEFIIIGEAKNGEELVDLANQLQPDVIVADINMSDLGGVSAMQIISKDLPDIGVIAWCSICEEDMISEAVASGAKAYLLKGVEPFEVVDAIKAVSEGKNYFCSESQSLVHNILSDTFNKTSDKTAGVIIAKQERDVLNLTAQEFTSNEIAGRLGLTKKTVDGIKERLIKKFGVKTMVGAILFAYKNKLIGRSDSV
jgi:DNA-binding NarL/FixJ family response regulator